MQLIYFVEGRDCPATVFISPTSHRGPYSLVNHQGVNASGELSVVKRVCKTKIYPSTLHADFV